MDIGTTLLISVTSLIVIGIGAYIAYVVGKKHNSSEDWMVGGRSLPVYVVGFSQAATAVGGGVLVAHVGIAYAWGLSVFWYELFVVVGMIIFVLFPNGCTRETSPLSPRSSPASSETAEFCLRSSPSP